MINNNTNNTQKLQESFVGSCSIGRDCWLRPCEGSGTIGAGPEASGLG